MRKEYVSGYYINLDDSKGEVFYGYEHLAYKIGSGPAEELINSARANGASFFSDESGYEYILIYDSASGELILQRK